MVGLRKHAERQYEKELLFSSLVDLMALVVCGTHPSVHKAYKAMRTKLPVHCPNSARIVTAIHARIACECRRSTRWRGHSGCRAGCSLLAQDVFYVLGADVSRLHHLGDRARDRAGPEQLDEQGESDDLLMDGTGACSEQLEVGVSGLGERGEGGRQGAGGGARLVIEQGLLVGRVLDVFADGPGAGVQRDSLGTEEDRDAVVVGADDPRAAPPSS